MRSAGVPGPEDPVADPAPTNRPGSPVGSAEAIPVHPAGGLGGGGLRLPVVHPVAGAAARARSRVWSAGISAAIGYGLGVLGARVWREFADRPARPTRPRSWRVFLIAAPVLLLISYLLGQRWQGQIRDLMGAEPEAFGLEAVAAGGGGAGLRRSGGRRPRHPTLLLVGGAPG